MVEVLDDGGNAMANAMQSSDIAKDIKRVMLKVLNRISSFLYKRIIVIFRMIMKYGFKIYFVCKMSGIVHSIKTFAVQNARRNTIIAYNRVHICLILT